MLNIIKNVPSFIILIFSRQILHILEIIAMIILINHLPFWLWNVIAIFLIILYLAGKAYYAINEKDESYVVKFWYHARTVVFILDILIVIGFYTYLIISLIN